MHHLSLVGLEKIITFDEYNFNEWLHALRFILKKDQKLYILEGPIPKQPTLTGRCSRYEHDIWWKHH